MKFQNPVSVLVVDDAPVIRKQVIEMLSEYPDINVVGEAGEIAEALLWIIRKQPDAVILDISMPGGNGFNLLEYVKNHKIDTKIIMLSNYSESSYRTQASIYGADYFFDKSNEFEKVVDALFAIGEEKEHKGVVS